MKKRIDELDMVKGISMIYVFFRHICELTGVNIYSPAVYTVFDHCTESAMFLFVLLSGYVYKSKGSIWHDIRLKFRQLLIPYLIYFSFFTVMYFIRYILVEGMAPGLFLRNAFSDLTATLNLDIPALGSGFNVMNYATVPYWYIAEIFTAFVPFIIISKGLEGRPIRAKIIAAVCLLAGAGLLMHLDPRGLLADTFTSGTTFFMVETNILGFAAVLLIGSILREYRVFDVEAHPKTFTRVMFVLCLALTVTQIILYDNRYAMQYGNWGQYGPWSAAVTPLTGFALTYSLIYICHYLKRIRPVKTALVFIGSNTMDILLLHFGIGELVCLMLGCWVSIYSVPYPAELFAWWHFALAAVLTAGIILGYLYIKKAYRKKARAEQPKGQPA